MPSSTPSSFAVDATPSGDARRDSRRDARGHAAPGFTLVATAWDDERAVALRAEMDAELAARYAPPADAPPEPAAFARARTIALQVDPATVIETVLALDADGTPLGQLALRRLGEEFEIKRVIVAAAARGRGVGSAMMARAISVAREAGAPRVILQTGSMQPESIALYGKLGFTPIPVYEPYIETMSGSLCFELVLS